MKQAMVEVLMEGDQEPTIVWRRNGKVIALDSLFKQSIRIEGGRVSVILTIANVSLYSVFLMRLWIMLLKDYNL